MPDELDDLDRPVEPIQSEELRSAAHTVTEEESCRYAGIALASIRGAWRTRTELDGQTATELWRRLCRRAHAYGALSDEAARLHCVRVFRYARADARRAINGRRAAIPPFDEQPVPSHDPHREWTLAHLHLLTERQRQAVGLALDGLSLQEIEAFLRLAAGGAWPLMERAEQRLIRERKKGQRDG